MDLAAQRSQHGLTHNAAVCLLPIDSDNQLVFRESFSRDPDQQIGQCNDECKTNGYTWVCSDWDFGSVLAADFMCGRN